MVVPSRSTDGSQSHLRGNLVGTDVLRDKSARTLIVLGDAGAGKSTLLKAYGVGVLGRSSGLRVVGVGRETPILVPLRRLARGMDKLEKGATLADYIRSTILYDDAGLGSLAAPHLNRLLRRRGCIVLLDGLDEVIAADYVRINDLIRQFNTMAIKEEWRVRIVVTCRQQNFRARRGEWITSFAKEAFELAAFSDDDIRAYAERRRGSFESPHTPETFVSAVFDAGLADLHRVPLVAQGHSRRRSQPADDGRAGMDGTAAI